MFRTLANTSLRRTLHTSTRAAAPARPARLRAALGASAVAASYFVWSSWNGDRIALDAPSSSSKQAPLTSKASASPKAISHSPSTATEHSPSLPDSPPSEFVEEHAPEEGEATPAPAGEAEEGESGGSGAGGAFNPETGEINWDCPCLGGMAHGPCGLQFREAFSCFVFSEAEPKGIDCVEKFKMMQECFREHPDVYGDDIMNDDDDEDLPPLSDAAPSADTAEIPTQAASPSPEADSAAAPAPVQKSKPRSSTPTSA
ncbi:uncharacterized protein TRAVEDRAFT_26201 [Trametes versicolor FP-101664 SS1]|uniref:uncharacterized protein n=1 Tax=Trametes versicolor (strain FP-101664) TaxID=717944 RepID=UPI000462168F|nr:uncharacterized protein TRAVEDRAFT_26201 [Trametes versicolor FP-101664 SS1]EIW62445.1 hypothetical protein TRAVEDRAFT_26201 [Trametes versicolor FP-101664 SS1]